MSSLINKNLPTNSSTSISKIGQKNLPPIPIKNYKDYNENYTYDDDNNYEDNEPNYYDNYKDDGEFPIHQSTTNTLEKNDKKFPSFPPSPPSDEDSFINSYNNNKFNDNYNNSYDNNYNGNDIKNSQISPELPGLPELSSSPPISHQLPQEYFPENGNELDDDQQSNIYTTPELTIDDLYHLMINMRKGFQLQVKGLNKQYDLNGKKRIGVMGREKKSTMNKKKGDDATTASSVRSTTREMERFGGEGRWFHNE
ncbi:13237_t:CDS:2 [Entrophospora sp. SA101]|nr:13237_t:CDS:2 [Entrophospora sp. SA101]